MLNNVAVDDPVQASTMNEVITHVNTTPNRAIFTSDGHWTVPQGCHSFKVYLCGGGTRGLWFHSESGSYGVDGGRSPLTSKYFQGFDVGTTFPITIGAAGLGTGSLAERNGGTSYFGTLLHSTGGLVENSAMGSHNGDIIHGNELFCVSLALGPAVGGSVLVGYGAPGAGDKYRVSGYVPTPPPSPGGPGICVIEW